MEEKTTTFELLEPTSPEVLVPNSWVEPWMIWVAAILFLGILALIILRKKKSPAADTKSVREAAHREAAASLEEIGDVLPREAAVICSLVIRRYLSIAANDPALFETHEEYLGRDKSLNGFSEEARASAQHGFSQLAAIKYSPAAAGMETRQVVDESRALLTTLHQGFTA